MILREKKCLRTRKIILSNLNVVNEFSISKPKENLLFTHKCILGKTEIKKNEIWLILEWRGENKTLYALENEN